MKDSAHNQASATTVAPSTEVSWSDFGPFLKRLRLRRGISQETLAERLACHRTHIWRLEHRRHHPSRMFLRSLELVCGPLTTEEAATLRIFDQLLKYQMDELSDELLREWGRIVVGRIGWDSGRVRR